MDIDKLLENAIEITRHYYFMERKKMLPPIEDSKEFAGVVSQLSKEFEKMFQGVNFENSADFDYYEEIMSFATVKLVESYGWMMNK